MLAVKFQQYARAGHEPGGRKGGEHLHAIEKGGLSSEPERPYEIKLSDGTVSGEQAVAADPELVVIEHGHRPTSGRRR